MLEETNVETTTKQGEETKKPVRKCVVCKGAGVIFVDKVTRSFYHTKEVTREEVKCPKCGE